MAHSSDRLRAIFGIQGGVDKAENILKAHGVEIHDFIIDDPVEGVEYPEEVYDAVEYLCTEWDYATKGSLRINNQ